MAEADSTQRHITLDALRGFAVMGIVAMNIIVFAMPEWAVISPIVFHDSLGDRISWLFSFIFVEGKMRGLFSLLFGASMMLIIERAEAKGENAATVHYTRMVWLALFGLAHYFLLWLGDILFTYAAIGCLAFLFHTWEPKRLILWALIVFALGFVMYGVSMGGLQFMQWAASQPDASVSLVRDYKDMMAEFNAQANVVNNIALHRGDWSSIVAHKWANPFEPVYLVISALTETLPLMMLGMAMLKNGFLTGQWESTLYRRWAIRLLPASIIVTTALGALCWVLNFDVIMMLSAYQAWAIIPRLMMTLGYAALLILIIRALADSPWLARIAATGRAAFTNYLGTSIVMTSLFYGYGLGLYGHVGRPALWLFVIAAGIVMLLWSKPWLERFYYGPLEWLWRSLARMKAQPFRISKMN